MHAMHCRPTYRLKQLWYRDKHPSCSLWQILHLSLQIYHRSQTPFNIMVKLQWMKTWPRVPRKTRYRWHQQTDGYSDQARRLHGLSTDAVGSNSHEEQRGPMCLDSVSRQAHPCRSSPRALDSAVRIPPLCQDQPWMIETYHKSDYHTEHGCGASNAFYMEATVTLYRILTTKQTITIWK